MSENGGQGNGEKTGKYSPSYEEFSSTREKVAALSERVDNIYENFAKKTDLEELKSEIPNLKVWALTGVLGIFAILGSWLITVIINVVIKVLT